MIILLHILVLTGIFFWTSKKFLKPIFSLALITKIAAGLCLGLLYQHYYTSGDTWTFFEDATNASLVLRSKPSELVNFFCFSDWTIVGKPMITTGMNAFFMIKWVTFFNLITGDNYWIVSVYFSIISFGGCWLLFKSLSDCYTDLKVEVALAVLFIPSIVFWSAGVIKECLAFGALCALSGIFIRWHKKNVIAWGHVLILLVALWILWFLKYYWLAVWLAAFGPSMVIKLLSNRLIWIKRHSVVAWFIMFLISVISVSVLHPNFYYYRIADVVVKNYLAFINLSAPEDVIIYTNIEPNLLSLAKNAPWAVLSACFRPFIWEASTIFQFLTAFENLVLLTLFFISIARIRRWFVDLTDLHVAIFVYLILLAAFLALSTPNFGSLSRYRIGFTPLLWLVLLITSGIKQYIPDFIKTLITKD